MKENIKDIQTDNDIKLLVDEFYKKVNNHTLLSPIFNQHAQVDWEKHLPNMYNFWSSILLGSMSYSGSPFSRHVTLPIESAHFDEWISLFNQTIDEHFQGPTAEEAKKRASIIGQTFQYKMGLLK